MRARILTAGAAAAIGSMLTGCHPQHHQSMIHPAGEAAAHIAWLTWVLMAICTVVFLATMALLVVAITRRASDPLGNRFIAVAGLIIPAAILTTILIVSVSAQVSLRTPASAQHTIRVVGHKYWWHVEYPEHAITTANELYIPAGEVVLLELTSADVIHSFWVPNLNGKMDMLPEQTTRFWLHADRPGIYRGQCAEYCGKQHAKMAFDVIVVTREQYADWVAGRQRAHAEPTNEQLARGRSLFFSQACHNCHAIRGTRAAGLIGPDLTHVGGRRMIASVLPNTHENLARWIRNPQLDKPGNRMPHSTLPDDDVHAITNYLKSLK